MKSNNIKSISIVGDHDLFFIIEYNNGVRKSFELDDLQLQSAKSYLQSQGKQSVSQSELQGKSYLQSENNSNKASYLPWIISGALGVGVIIGLIIWLATRSKNKV